MYNVYTMYPGMHILHLHSFARVIAKMSTMAYASRKLHRSLVEAKAGQIVHEYTMYNLLAWLRSCARRFLLFPTTAYRLARLVL